jgi:hypothetical protein
MEKIDSLYKVRSLKIQNVHDFDMGSGKEQDKSRDLQLAGMQALIDSLYEIDKLLQTRKDLLKLQVRDYGKQGKKLRRSVKKRISSYFEGDSLISIKKTDVRLEADDGPREIHMKLMILKDRLDHAVELLEKKRVELKRLEEERMMSVNSDESDHMMDPGIKERDLINVETIHGSPQYEIRIHALKDEIRIIKLEIEKIRAQIEIFEEKKRKQLKK